MADMQWPSEEEDFDAVTNDDVVKSFSNSQPEKLSPKPFKKPANKVAVAVSEPNPHQVQETEDDIDRAFAEPVEHREELETPAAAPARKVPERQRPVQIIGNPPKDHQPEPAEDAAPSPDTSEHSPEQYEHVSDHKVKKQRSGNASSIARTLFELVLVVALAGVGYYAYTLSNDKNDLKSQVSTLQANPQIAIQKQTDDLISTVGSLMTLPANETPTVANVSDAVKAKAQSNFFANAQNGDKVLMYVKSGQAILFRPSTQKIILVAPLTFNSDAAATTNKATTTTTGTGTVKR